MVVLFGGEVEDVSLFLQVWGPREGPYEFKPAPSSSTNDMFSSPLNLPIQQPMDKRIEGSFVLQD